MAKSNGKHSLDLETLVKKYVNKSRLTSMELKNQKTYKNGTHAFRLQGTGERKGHSDIRIQQVNGELLVTDCVKLPKNYSGYEDDIVLLKKIMYEDAGAQPHNGITGLHYEKGSKGYVLSFKLSGEKTKRALSHYLNLTAEIMSEYFKGNGSIDLAFSMARQRVGR